MRVEDRPIPDYDEPAGTILVGSQNKRAYLFVAMTEERMKIERENAARQGVQDLREFVFVFDGRREVFTYEQLKDRLFNGPVHCTQPAIDDIDDM